MGSLTTKQKSLNQIKFNQCHIGIFGKSYFKKNITLVTAKEQAKLMKSEPNLNPKKTPGFVQIKGESLTLLLKKGGVVITCLFNAVFHLKHVPTIWKEGGRSHYAAKTRQTDQSREIV